MRFKYKAYLKDFESIVDVCVIDFLNGHVGFMSEGGVLYKVKFDEVELMQNTGLKDIKGIEVFQGCILQNDERTWEVVCQKEDFSISAVEQCKLKETWDLRSVLQGICGKPAIVVGNIYENPEVLK